MTPYRRRTSSASAASSRNESGLALTASRTGPDALCGIISLRPGIRPHYSQIVYTRPDSGSGNPARAFLTFDRE